MLISASYLFITMVGVSKVQYYFHRIEYRLFPERFINKSKKVSFDIYGIDVSHHNGTIDWEMVFEKGLINKKPVSFVFIKATEGKNFLDKNYKRNIKESRNQGFICGSYHFYRPEINSITQFNNFKSVVKLKKGDLAPVLDVELRGNLSYEKYQQGILNILELMENYYGIKPILYTSPVFYASLSNNEKVKEYPLWLSSYTEYTANQNFDRLSFLQYTNHGKVAGIKGLVDLNGFNGDKLMLQKFIIK